MEHQLRQLLAREEQWALYADASEDNRRVLEYKLHVEKGERLKQDTELLVLRREVGPAGLAMIRNRIREPVLRPTELSMSVPPLRLDPPSYEESSPVLSRMLPSRPLSVRNPSPPVITRPLPSQVSYVRNQPRPIPSGRTSPPVASSSKHPIQIRTDISPPQAPTSPSSLPGKASSPSHDSSVSESVRNQSTLQRLRQRKTDSGKNQSGGPCNEPACTICKREQSS